ncbi:MAG: hypothetical protein ABEJ95_05915 [Candidatus Nanohalobium sp.]
MVVVLDSTGMELGKHAYAQMMDFGVDPELREEDVVDVPRVISQSDERYFLFVVLAEERFVEQVMGKVLDLEEDVHVEKVVLKRKEEGREVFERRAARKVREKSEVLAEEVAG